MFMYQEGGCPNGGECDSLSGPHNWRNSRGLSAGESWLIIIIMENEKEEEEGEGEEREKVGRGRRERGRRRRREASPHTAPPCARHYHPIHEHTQSFQNSIKWIARVPLLLTPFYRCGHRGSLLY